MSADPRDTSASRPPKNTDGDGALTGDRNPAQRGPEPYRPPIGGVGSTGGYGPPLELTGGRGPVGHSRLAPGWGGAFPQHPCRGSRSPSPPLARHPLPHP